MPFYFVLGYTFGFHSMGKIAAGFLMIRFERFGEVLALKRSSRIYLCNFSFCFWFAMLAVEEELFELFYTRNFFRLAFGLRAERLEKLWL